MTESKSINLRIPGPTPLPPQVREAISQQMINHRGPGFAVLFREVIEGLRPVFQTAGDILVLSTSGTGGMEACVANTVSPGDTVLVVSIGTFGDRFAHIAEAYGCQVLKLSFPMGKAAEPAAVLQELKAHPDCRVVFITHNETSTGVTNDVQALAAAVRSLGERVPLLVVDAISSLGGIELPMDEWGCDIVITASQKAWMAPPGLAMIGISSRAWPYIERAKSPRFYFDLITLHRYAEEGYAPYTPVVSAFYGLRQALALMAAEGLPNIYARHRRLGAKLRQGLKSLGLELLADEAHASDTLTGVYIPPDFDPEEWLQRLEDEHGVVVSGGLGPLKGKIFRIAHMGYVHDSDIEGVLAALEALLCAGPRGR